MEFRRAKRVGAVATAVAGALLLSAGNRAPAAELPPPTPDEAANRLPTGKAITPTGAQTPLGSLPLNMVLSPGGQFLVTTSNGFRQSLNVVSTVDGSTRSTFSSPHPVSRTSHS